MMKTILITGGSDGLGKALAEKLAEIKDYEIVVLARNEQALQNVAEKTRCDYIVCDVRDAKQVHRAFNEAAQKHGRIDVLINNAGIVVNGELVDTKDEDIQNIIMTNTLGSIYAAKAALKYMKPRRNGLIVNVVSQSGLNAKANRSVYNASKFALTGFTKALQEEAGAYGVRVTGFYPGTINTDMFAKAGIEMHGPSLTADQAVKAIEFLLGCDEGVLIPELGVKILKR